MPSSDWLALLLTVKSHLLVFGWLELYGFVITTLHYGLDVMDCSTLWAGPYGWYNVSGVQHNWGGGHRLAGEVLENVTLPHRERDPKILAGKLVRIHA